MAGERAKGATVYVTLEPCRERSTGAPSCSQRLIEAGVSKVIIATRDPHPLRSGGIEALRESGIPVELGPLREQADEFYQDFFKAVTEADS